MSARFHTGWLVALVLAVLLAGAAVFIGVLPLVSCPQATHETSEAKPCYRCDDRGRITLLDRWRNGAEPLPEWEGMEVESVHALFDKLDPQSVVESAGISPGARITRRQTNDAIRRLMKSGHYVRAGINIEVKGGKALVQVVVDDP